MVEARPAGDGPRRRRGAPAGGEGAGGWLQRRPAVVGMSWVQRRWGLQDPVF
jgi:hypothetical protein